MAITADIQQQVFDLLSRASNFSFIAAEQDSGGQIGLSPGQKVIAEVLATLSDGRVQVRVGGERFNLDLPLTVRPGQNLEMTYVTGEPRSTFAIARPHGATPPVTLSDASRLLALLSNGAQIEDPGLRLSLKSVGEMLRSSPGSSAVLANLMDEALTYGGLSVGNKAGSGLPTGSQLQTRDANAGQVRVAGRSGAPPEQTPLAAFESSATRVLQQIARSSRSILVEAVNPPLVPLSLFPGEEVDASVLGTLPGGRTFVRVAGTDLELVLPRAVREGEILRMTLISSQPKPVFAISRTLPEPAQGALSEAGRWLSILEQSGDGYSDQQRYVLDRLATILKSLPPDSPAFTAIKDEPITYRPLSPAARQAVDRSVDQGGLAIADPALPSRPGIPLVISDDMAKLLQALIKGNRLTLLEALNQQSHPAALEPGHQLKGDVLALLGGGRFLVQVEELAFEFTLPKGTQPGDRLTLFFITDEPKATFLMARFGRPGEAQLSEAGRWLSSFLGTTAEQIPARETLGILRTLLLGPPADAARVGSQLQQGLRESGLFYESHLGRWFGGDYPLEDLLREPQGRLSRLKHPETASAADGGAAQELIVAGMKERLPAMGETALGKGESGRGREGIVDRASQAIVGEQLEALQSGQVVFRGELFAGQQLEWSVREREARRNAAGGRERSWNSELRIDLPRLGSVSARLKLDGTRISIDLTAGDAGSTDLLESGRPALVEQLQAAGLQPAEIGIRHGES